MRLWQQDLDGGVNEPDAASSVAVDPRGDVAAAGVTVNAVGNFTVMKFSAAGTKLWQQDLSGTAGSAAANSVAVNARGDVVAGGITINTNNDFISTVAKFSRDGTGLWRHDLNGTGAGAEQAFCVAIDNGGVVVAGGETSNSSSALTVLRFDKE